MTELGSNQDEVTRNAANTEVACDGRLFYTRHFLDQGLHFSTVKPNQILHHLTILEGSKGRLWKEPQEMTQGEFCKSCEPYMFLTHQSQKMILQRAKGSAPRKMNSSFMLSTLPWWALLSLQTGWPNSTAVCSEQWEAIVYINGPRSVARSQDGTYWTKMEGPTLSHLLAPSTHYSYWTAPPPIGLSP